MTQKPNLSNSVFDTIRHRRSVRSYLSRPIPRHILKAIIEAGATKFNLWSLSEFEAQNAIYLKKIQEESNVSVRKLSQETLTSLYEITQQIISDQCAADPLSKKVYASFSEFQKRVTGWSEWTEKAYYSMFNPIM